MLDQIRFWSIYDTKEAIKIVICNNVNGYVIDVKFLDSSRTQRFKCCENKNISFSLNRKIHYYTIRVLVKQKNNFLAELTFNLTIKQFSIT